MSPINPHHQQDLPEASDSTSNIDPRLLALEDGAQTELTLAEGVTSASHRVEMIMTDRSSPSPQTVVDQDDRAVTPTPRTGMDQEDRCVTPTPQTEMLQPDRCKTPTPASVTKHAQLAYFKVNETLLHFRQCLDYAIIIGRIKYAGKTRGTYEQMNDIEDARRPFQRLAIELTQGLQHVLGVKAWEEIKCKELERSEVKKDLKNESNVWVKRLKRITDVTELEIVEEQLDSRLFNLEHDAKADMVQLKKQQLLDEEEAA